MTDEQKPQDESTSSIPEESTTQQEVDPAAISDLLGTDDIDVESALAAVASLHELAQEDEDVEEDTAEDVIEPELPDDVDDEEESSEVQQPVDEDDASSYEQEDDDELPVISLAEDAEEALEPDDTRQEDPEETLADAEDFEEAPVIAAAIRQPRDEGYAEAESPYETEFPHPPLSFLHRGQSGSIIPAFVLIASGAILTILVTTQDFQPGLWITAALGVSVLGVAILAQWFSSGRWSDGAFFLGVLLLLMGAATAYLIAPNNLNLVDGWPVLGGIIGLAFVLTDLVQASSRRLWMFGLGFAVAGFSGMAVTTSLLNKTALLAFQSLWPVALVLVVIILVIPMLRQNG